MQVPLLIVTYIMCYWYFDVFHSVVSLFRFANPFDKPSDIPFDIPFTNPSDIPSTRPSSDKPWPESLR